MVRLRQAVIAARDLDAVAGRLRDELGLGEPFADPGVGYFGLRNAVFALEDTFLEVVSPTREDTAAGRLIERRGGNCGYMLMFQVQDLTAARERIAAEGVREVFAVELDDMAEVHLHPADMRAAIVSVSQPRPPESWRWGGEAWAERSAPVRLYGAEVAVADAAGVERRWRSVLGELPARLSIATDAAEPGLVEIVVTPSNGASGLPAPGTAVEFERVRVTVAASEPPEEDLR